VGLRTKNKTWDTATNKDSYYIRPPHCNRGEILAHAFGTCHCRSCHRDTKAMARAKPTRQKTSKLIKLTTY